MPIHVIYYSLSTATFYHIARINSEITFKEMSSMSRSLGRSSANSMASCELKKEVVVSDQSIESTASLSEKVKSRRIGIGECCL